MTKQPTQSPRSKASGKTSGHPAERTATRTTRPAVKPGEATDATAPGKPTKLDLLTNHLGEPGGATIAELTAATGWQPHSVRGAMSGALKRKGLTVTSEMTDGVRRYRIGAPQ